LEIIDHREGIESESALCFQQRGYGRMAGPLFKKQKANPLEVRPM
jgi:hypothetical protein